MGDSPWGHLAHSGYNHDMVELTIVPNLKTGVISVYWPRGAGFGW